MAKYIELDDRSVIEISGEDRKNFLQGIITNDIGKVKEGEGIYALLLSPQGKFLFDFFIVENGDKLALDCEKVRVNDLIKRLMMYKLRSKVEIKITDKKVFVIMGGRVSGGIVFKDPRHEEMGFRVIADNDIGADEKTDRKDYEDLRISLVIPEGGKDMFPEKSFPMQNNMEKVNAIDFNKGCYVGQEVTARSKHRAQIRKKIVKIEIKSPPPAGTPIMADARQVGEVLSSSGNYALAIVDYEEAGKNREKLSADGKALSIFL